MRWNFTCRRRPSVPCVIRGRRGGRESAAADHPQILEDARRAMELEDAYVAWLEGKPVPQLRHRRRSLRARLMNRPPDPVPMSAPMTSV